MPLFVSFEAMKKKQPKGKNKKQAQAEVEAQAKLDKAKEGEVPWYQSPIPKGFECTSSQSSKEKNSSGNEMSNKQLKASCAPGFNLPDVNSQKESVSEGATKPNALELVPKSSVEFGT